MFWLPFASVRLIEDEGLKIDVSSRASAMRFAAFSVMFAQWPRLLSYWMAV